MDSFQTDGGLKIRSIVHMKHLKWVVNKFIHPNALDDLVGKEEADQLIAQTYARTWIVIGIY